MTYKKLVLKELKNRAHLLVNEMKEMGIPQSYIWSRLEHKYGIGKGNAHFGKMYTTAQVSRGILALEEIRMSGAKKFKKKKVVVPTPPKPKEKEYTVYTKERPNILPLTKQKKLYRRLKMMRLTPKWFKWIWKYI